MLTSLLSLTVIIVLKILFRKFFFKNLSSFKGSLFRSQDSQGVSTSLLKKVMSFKSFDSLLYSGFSVVFTLYFFSPVCSYTAGKSLDIAFLSQYVCPPPQITSGSTFTNSFYVALGLLSGVGVGYLFARSKFSFALELENIVKRATKASVSDMASEKKLLLSGDVLNDTNSALNLLNKRLDIEKSVVDYLRVPLREFQTAVSECHWGAHRFQLDEIRPVSEMTGLSESALTRLFHVVTVEKLASVPPHVAQAQIGLMLGLDLDTSVKIYNKLEPFYVVVEQAQKVKLMDPILVKSITQSTQELTLAVEDFQTSFDSAQTFQSGEVCKELLALFLAP